MLWHHNARVNSHQRWKQTRFRVCFHLWCELTLALWCHSIVWSLFFMKYNVTEWQVSWNSWRDLRTLLRHHLSQDAQLVASQIVVSLLGDHLLETASDWGPRGSEIDSIPQRQYKAWHGCFSLDMWQSAFKKPGITKEMYTQEAGPSLEHLQNECYWDLLLFAAQYLRC